MRTITLNVDDATYQYLEGYSRQTGRDIPDLASDCLSNSLSMLDFSCARERMKRDIDDWKQEHDWDYELEKYGRGRELGQHGSNKTIPHFVC